MPPKLFSIPFALANFFLQDSRRYAPQRTTFYGVSIVAKKNVELSNNFSLTPVRPFGFLGKLSVTFSRLFELPILTFMARFLVPFTATLFARASFAAYSLCRGSRLVSHLRKRRLRPSNAIRVPSHSPSVFFSGYIFSARKPFRALVPDQLLIPEGKSSNSRRNHSPRRGHSPLWKDGLALCIFGSLS